MEKKTMGEFLAVLRKARGMTQKELAERLNVSDKTVSRWEREEGYPDLALIPVIAEIFDVTCDELLRGQRKTEAEQKLSQEGDSTRKGEKERQRLLKLTLSRFENQMVAAMGVSAAGVAVAMIGNLAFLRGRLGFLLGTIFYIISIVMQNVWRNQANLSVEDAGLSEAELSDFRRQIIRLGQRAGYLTAGCLGFALPLLLAGTYEGVPLALSVLLGLVCLLLGLAVYGVMCWFLNARYVRQRVYILEEKDEAVYWHNHGLKKKYVCRAAAVLILTLAFHAFGSEMIWNQGSLVQGYRFEDYDSFVAFMEQDISESRVWINSPFGEASVQAVAPAQAVQQEEERTETLEDASGNVVCRYAWRNASVSTIRPTPGAGTALPITVTTHAQQAFARNTAEIINVAYCILYPLEILAVFLIYFKRRMQ